METHKISSEYLQNLKANFEADRSNLIALNAGVKHGPDDLLLSRRHQELVGHVFSHKVTEVKPVTNQKSSGRCWIFALLNVIRQQCQSHFNVEELDFSQTYLFFYDKIERIHYLLKMFVKLFKKGEEIDGRLLMFLLHDPMEDGGQWGMLVNLVEKYGLMPKSAHSEAFCSTNSRKMNGILNQKIREYCTLLKVMIVSEKSDDEISSEIDRMMNEAYRVCAICLGIPPATFDWEYYDKNKKYTSFKNLTPYDFYHKHIKPIFNMEDKVCIVNDPRSCHEYGKLYTVECLNNMTDGQLVLYINQPIDALRRFAIKSLRNNEAVWFGCDVGKHLDNKLGAMNLDLHDYDLVFGFSMLGITKAQRLLSGASMMTHAMVFTGINIIEEGEERQDQDNDTATCRVSRWRVENSWGEEMGSKGYYVMTDDWFGEYMYEVVIDKKYLPDEVLNVLKQEPVVLPAWDPMGALAN